MYLHVLEVVIEDGHRNGKKALYHFLITGPSGVLKISGYVS